MNKPDVPYIMDRLPLPSKEYTMNDDQLLRYSRQILLQDIGIEGQEQFLAAKVLIIGMGGLGSPVVMYLAASGVGHLTLVDFDEVDLSNLQRQIVHHTGSIGQAKVSSAKQSVKRINPDINIHTIDKKQSADELQKLTASHDIVIDCSDNFATRFLINQSCILTKTALISGAVIQLEGQVTTFDPRKPNTACYRCLYDEEGENDDSCSANGILSPVAGIIGSIQATEALKLIAGLPTLCGRLLILDAKSMEWRTMHLKKDPCCPVCSHQP